MDTLKWSITHPFQFLYAVAQAIVVLVTTVFGLLFVVALHIVVYGGIGLVSYAIVKWAWTTVVGQ